jgi:hypothetical protein
MALLGALTGLHAATWGAFKDAPFEHFNGRSFARSVLLGAVVGCLLALTTSLPSTQSVVVLIGLLYTGERLVTEWWKTFLREDPQSAYTIPMRLALLGRPVDARIPRYVAGAASVVGLVAVCALVQPFPHADTPPWGDVAAGGLSGWLIAAGGAWKDAPIEGFSPWKFLRSPLVATAWACLLLPATHEWLPLALAAGGLSVLSIETWKAFLTGGRPPGKFRGKPVLVPCSPARDLCRLVHSALYLLLACGLGLGHALPGMWTGADRGRLTTMAAMAGASAVCALVANGGGLPRVTMLGQGTSRSVAGSAATPGEPRADGDLRGKST